VRTLLAARDAVRQGPPRLFAYEPLNGYADARDAVALPWDRLERELLGGG
jgi:hypothetical protein